MAEEVSKVNDWLKKMEQDPEWLEVENRPWANDHCRWSRSHCQGYDFVHYDPKIKLRFFWNDKTQMLTGSIHWDNRTEGPPGGAHGATIMFVFDEVLAYPVWRTGVPAFTANVNINLRKMVPFNTAALFSARVARSEGRKRFVEGVITMADGVTKYADATGLWIVSQGIGTSLQVWNEVIDADRQRMEKGERVLVAPFQISAATPGAKFELSQGPIPAPAYNETLPFQTNLYKGEITSCFSDAIPAPTPFPRYKAPTEPGAAAHNAALDQQQNDPRSYFVPSKL